MNRQQAAKKAVGAAIGREAFHTASLRKGRSSIPNQIYLLTFVTHARQKIFSDWQSFRPVLHCLQHAQVHREASTLAYCAMPDHLHWLIELHEGTDLSNLAGRVKSNSARLLNKIRTTVGLPKLNPVWQAGFHDHALRKEENLQNFARYVVANPLRAGLVSHIGDYSLWDAKWL